MKSIFNNENPGVDFDSDGHSTAPVKLINLIDFLSFFKVLFYKNQRLYVAQVGKAKIVMISIKIFIQELSRSAMIELWIRIVMESMEMCPILQVNHMSSYFVITQSKWVLLF
jgi:hypothetical protein